MSERKAVRRALVSVYDKSGLIELATGLHEAGVELVSTGSTASKIADAGIPVTPVEALTGFPECLEGRVKTLHPRVHAGVLADTRKPDHLAQLEELGIATVVCPPIPGAFSALGLVGTDLRRDYVRTVYATAATADPSVLEAAFRALEAEGSSMLERAGVAADRRRLERSVDARYAGQSYELNVPVADGAIDPAAIGAMAEAFHHRHAQTYGHDNRAEPVQFVSLRLAAIGLIPPLTIRQHPAAAGTPSAKPVRDVWFRSTGAVAAEVHDRSRLAEGVIVSGPAVIESLESTVLIPPGWQARMDGDGFILMARANK